MNSDAVKMDKKLEKIKTVRNLLFEKIAYAESNIQLNTNKILQNLEDHNDFIHFVELMKVYELYKWKNLKSNYTTIKKKTNLDKKVYGQIIKIYSNITQYLSEQDVSNIGKTIRKIQSNNDVMIYNYIFLQKKHRDILNKCKYLIKNDQITKIYEITDQVQPLITKLYENYIDIKIVNKKSKLLKNEKSNILGEIQRINESINELK
jgi:hypothetical protein